MVTTISSTTNSNFHHQLHNFSYEDTNNHLYDATNFSPYSKGNYNEGTIVGRLGEPSQKLSPLISIKKSPIHQKLEENGEIGVFGAEKYFNVEAETPRSASSIATPKYLHQRDEAMVTAARKHTLLPYGTPSIRSESTCNSQSALLQSGMVMRNSSRSKREKGQAKSVLAGLGFKCSCSDKDSVDAGEISFRKPSTYGAVNGKTRRKLVDIAALEATHSIKIGMPNPELLKINNVYFQKQESTYGVGLNSPKSSLAFSPLNSASGSQHQHKNQNHLAKMQHQLDEEAEMARNSLEVFGSPILKNKLKSLSFDRTTSRFVMSSSRDGTPRLEEIDSPYINDAASDASSDLFEIESIKSKMNPFLARQTSDIAAASSCLSPTNGYAPSEASIEWSVATASAAVMSDCEEQMSEITIRSPIRTFYSSNGKPKSTKEVQKRRPSMLLGCKSHKSVRVAGDAYITYDNPSSTPKLRNMISSTSQVPRFPSETKQGNFVAKQQQQQLHHAYVTPPLQQHSHSSPHASKLLYI